MVKPLYMNSPQENMYSYVKKNTGKKLSPMEMATELAKAKKGVQERNAPKSAMSSWIDGIKSDYRNGKIGERIQNNPVVKGLALVLGGLTSCTPIDKDMDLVTVDFADPVSNGPVNKTALNLVKTLGIPIVSATTPVQVFGFEDTTTNTKCELKIDKTASKADKIIYTGTSTNTKSGQVTPLRYSMTQSADKALIIEENTQNDQGEWIPKKTSEYKLNAKGNVAKFENGKEVCSYRYSGSDNNKMYVTYADGSKKELNNFVATQAHDTVKM